MALRRRMQVLALSAALLAVLAMPTAAGAQSPPQQCPVVVSNTTLETDCLGPMNVVADDVNVNLNGHQVVCASNLVQDGINIFGRSKVRIRNGHIHNCLRGINAVGGGEHQFTSLHVDGNSIGAFLEQSHGNYFAASRFVDNTERAIRLQLSDRTLIDAGMEFVGQPVHVWVLGNENVIRSSRFSGSVAEAIRIFSPFADNRVSGNRITGATSGPGVAVGGSRNVVIGNEIDANHRGIQIETPHGLGGNRIEANTVTGSRTEGITLDPLGRDNEVLRNRVSGNAIGIRAQASALAGNRFLENTARGNGMDLQDDNPNCGANIWLNNNNVTQNQPCID